MDWINWVTNFPMLNTVKLIISKFFIIIDWLKQGIVSLLQYIARIFKPDIIVPEYAALFVSIMVAAALTYFVFRFISNWTVRVFLIIIVLACVVFTIGMVLMFLGAL